MPSYIRAMSTNVDRQRPPLMSGVQTGIDSLMYPTRGLSDLRETMKKRNDERTALVRILSQSTSTRTRSTSTRSRSS